MKGAAAFVYIRTIGRELEGAGSIPVQCCRVWISGRKKFLFPAWILYA